MYFHIKYVLVEIELNGMKFQIAILMVKDSWNMYY